MTKILITGGLGNLGSWLTEYFASNGYEVWVLTKNYRKITSKAKFHLINCDISDYQDIKNHLKDLIFEYVIHAGSVNDGFVEHYFKLAIEVNTLGTRNLLEYFKDKSLKNFIYFSTFQVYGKYQGIITENTALVPKNDYGATHLFAEYYIKQFFYSHNLQHTIIRLTNSYGCPKDLKSSKWYLVLNDFAKTAFEKKEIILKSNGLAPRDFIWMGDVCTVLMQIAQLSATNEVYNLSGESTFTMLQIAEMVKQSYSEKYNFDIPISINKSDNTKYSSDLMVSSQKLKQIVAYKHHLNFKEEALQIFDFLEKSK